MEQAPPAGDVGQTILDWLSGILIPDWGALIGLLPILVILGLVGPVLTLLALYWLYHMLTDRRGRVRIAEPEPVAAPIGADGEPIFPTNTPYCARHALIFPATERHCTVDGDVLTVRCPVDESPRAATEELCRGCGTRYQLGASVAPVNVRSGRRPPEGGAAIA